MIRICSGPQLIGFCPRRSPISDAQKPDARKVVQHPTDGCYMSWAWVEHAARILIDSKCAVSTGEVGKKHA